MSFSKARIKRFNEIDGDKGPPVGSYDPKLCSNSISVIINKSERFAKSADLSASASSLPSLDTTSRATSIEVFPEFKTPLRTKSASSAYDKGKMKEYEKEIRRLMAERSSLLKELASKEEEVKKLENKMQTYIREKSSLKTSLVTLEKEKKELKRTQDILKTKILALETISQKKDLSDEVLKLMEMLTCNEHEMNDVRKELFGVRKELEECLMALHAKEEEIEELRRETSETIKVKEAELEQSSACILELKECNELLVEKTRDTDERLQDLYEELNFHKEMAQGLIEQKEALMNTMYECQKQLEIHQQQAAKTSEELRDENLGLLDRIEDQTSKWQCQERILSNELDNTYQKLASTEECSRALQEYRDALVGRVTALKGTVTELQDQQTVDMQTIKNLKVEIKEIMSQLSDKEQALSLSNTKVLSLTEQLNDLLKVQSEMTTLIEKCKSLEEEIDEGKICEEKLNGELMVTRLAIELAEIDVTDLRKCLAETKLELEEYKELCSSKTSQLEESEKQVLAQEVECDRLKEDNAKKEVALLQLQKSFVEQKSQMETKLEESDELKKTINAKDDQIAELVAKSDSATMQLYNLKVKLQEDETEKLDLNKRLEAKSVNIKHLNEKLQNLNAEYQEKIECQVAHRLKLKEDYEVQAAELAAALVQLQDCKTSTENIMSNLRDNVNRIECERQTLEMQHLETKNMRNLLHDELRKTQIELEETDRKLETSEKLVIELKEKVTMEAATNVTNIEKLTESETQVETLQKKVSTNLEQLQTKNDEIDKLNLARKDLQDELANLHTTLRETEEEVIELKAVIETNRQLDFDKPLVEELSVKTEQLMCMQETSRMQEIQITEIKNEHKRLEELIEQQKKELTLNKATLQWHSDREKELIAELFSVEENGKKEQQEHKRMLSDMQKKLEVQCERYKLEKEREGHQNEQMIQTITSDYEARLQRLAQEKSQLLQFQQLYEELQAKVEPFMEQLNAYEIDRKVLLSKNRETMHEFAELSGRYATLLGHQNHKQKIHYVVKMKEENLTLKEENTKLWSEVLKYRTTMPRRDIPGSAQRPRKPNKENTPLKDSE